MPAKWQIISPHDPSLRGGTTKQSPYYPIIKLSHYQIITLSDYHIIILSYYHIIPPLLRGGSTTAASLIQESNPRLTLQIPDSTLVLPHIQRN